MQHFIIEKYLLAATLILPANELLEKSHSSMLYFITEQDTNTCCIKALDPTKFTLFNAIYPKRNSIKISLNHMHEI